MSIADKLTTIAENMQKIYDAGYEAGKKAGGGSSAETITFTIQWISDTSCTAEKGMTWGEWADSEYNTIGALVDPDLNVIYTNNFTDENGDILEGMIIADEDTAEGVQLTEVIVANGTYILI